ncbi:MAG: hypothetical protein H6909_05035 [Rickettsiaceae bacterium]|nr:hypothetical protein [Rickettsiaceae bacterium]
MFIIDSKTKKYRNFCLQYDMQKVFEDMEKSYANIRE